ncbi:MAG: hypothetical protein GY828_06380 [Candidatus Gracilibacteria bacterium]|nr:hypothetical protein [Candidatus Gracilibacteria bacterium]
MMKAALLVGALSVAPNAESQEGINLENQPKKSPAICLAEGVSQETANVLSGTVSKLTKIKTENDFRNMNLEEFVANHKENQIKEQYEDFFSTVLNPDKVNSKGESKRSKYDGLSTEEQENLLEVYTNAKDLLTEDYFRVYYSEEYPDQDEAYIENRVKKGFPRFSGKLLSLYNEIKQARTDIDGQYNLEHTLNQLGKDYDGLLDIAGIDTIKGIIEENLTIRVARLEEKNEKNIIRGEELSLRNEKISSEKEILDLALQDQERIMARKVMEIENYETKLASLKIKADKLEKELVLKKEENAGYDELIMTMPIPNKGESLDDSYSMNTNE